MSSEQLVLVANHAITDSDRKLKTAPTIAIAKERGVTRASGPPSHCKRRPPNGGGGGTAVTLPPLCTLLTLSIYMADSAHPKTSDFLQRTVHLAARHKEGYDLKQSIHVFSCVQRKAYRSLTSVCVSRDTVLQEIRPGAGFETGDFVEETLGGLPHTLLLIGELCGAA